MCEIVDQFEKKGIEIGQKKGIEIGQKKGIEIGQKTAENRMGRFVRQMMQLGKLDELNKALEDLDYYHQLVKEMGL